MARSLDVTELNRDDLFELMEMVLDNLSPEDLVRLQEMTEAKRLEKLEVAKNAVIEEMRGRLERLGLSLEDLLPQRPAKRGDRRTGRSTGKVLPAKYRGPNGETWSGRGHIPQWLQALEESGSRRDDFLVNPTKG